MTMHDTAVQVAKESGQSQTLMDLLGLRFNESPVLRPSTDYRDGHLYMTVPVERDETTTVGRGKAAKEVTKRVWTTLAIRDDGSFFLYDEESVQAEDFRFPPTVLNQTKQRWHPDDMEGWLLGDRPHIDPINLYNDLRNVYQEHVEYPDDIYYDIVPLYVLGSYLYRLFKATGYIHFNGTAASGKSQNLRLIAAFGLNPIWSSNLSAASLFRTVAGAPGIICVDEAESFDSEKGAELRQLLLSGYADGAVAGRTEKGEGDRFQVVQYDTYSPKVIASINTLDPVLGSRCVIVPMSPAIRPIPDFLEDDGRWVALRNRAYRWAMQEATNVAAIRASWTLNRRAQEAPELRSRAWEIAQQYLVMGEHFGGEALVERLITFFNDYFTRQSKAREEVDRQYLLLKILPRLLSETQPHSENFYTLKEIHDKASSYLEEDAREYYKTKSVSRHLTVLGFKERKPAKGGMLVQIPEDQVRAEFAKRHITPFDEDVEWYEAKRSYQADRPVVQAMSDPLPPEMSWMDEIDDA